MEWKYINSATFQLVGKETTLKMMTNIDNFSTKIDIV